MQVSQYLHIVRSGERALCYHSLWGNLFLLEPLYVETLEQVRRGDKPPSTSLSIVEELIEAGYVVDEGLDERAFLSSRNDVWMETVSGGGQVRLLNLMISEACNFGCEHCLHKCSVAANPTHGERKFMDWQTAEQALDFYLSILDRWNISNPNIHFGSAEPLLNWSVLQKSVEHVSARNDNVSFAVNTNLSILTRDMACFLRDNNVYISTSLDGPVEGNDAIRTFVGGGGTFNQIVSKIDLLADVGYPLDGFSITINQLNFDAVTPGFIHWAADRGFKGIATDIDLINAENASISIEDCVAKLMLLRRICVELGLENIGSWTTAYDNLVNPPDDDMPTFCKAVKGRNLSVNPEGRVFVCGHTTTPLGNLDERELLLASDGPYVSLVRSRLPGNNVQCFRCELEGVCAGQCQITREVALATGNDRDTYLCRFYKLATLRLLEDKLQRELAAKCR